MHKVVKVVTTGSVGDLGRIARALADAHPPFDIAAVGGGEGVVGGDEVGIVTRSLIRNDDADDGEIVALMQRRRTRRKAGASRRRGAPGPHRRTRPIRRVASPTAAEAIGGDDINIMGVMLIDMTSTARPRRVRVRRTTTDRDAAAGRPAGGRVHPRSPDDDDVDQASRSGRSASGRRAGPRSSAGSFAPTRTAIVAASTRLLTPSLLRMCVTWTLAVFGLMNSTSAISPFERPAATSSRTSHSRAESPRISAGPRDARRARRARLGVGLGHDGLAG